MDNRNFSLTPASTFFDNVAVKQHPSWPGLLKSGDVTEGAGMLHHLMPTHRLLGLTMGDWLLLVIGLVLAGFLALLF